MARLFARGLFEELIRLGSIYRLAEMAGNEVAEAGDLAIAHFDYDNETSVTLVSTIDCFTGYLVDMRKSKNYKMYGFMSYNRFIHQ